MHTETGAPVLAGELARAWSQRISIIDQRGSCKTGGDQCSQALPTLLLDPDVILIWTADALQRPLSSVRLLEQMGRFAIVGYRPTELEQERDVLLALIPGSQDFHRAILDFQRARERAAETAGLWYYQAKETARRALLPLRMLKPHPLEADFAIRWLLLSCARGRMGQGLTQT